MNQIACFFHSKLYYKEKRIGYSKGMNIISTLYRAIIANVLDKDVKALSVWLPRSPDSWHFSPVLTCLCLF